MLKILVRSRKDANAVEASVEKFMRGWGIEVKALGGARGEKLVEAVASEADALTVVLLGREDSLVAERIEPLLPPFSVVEITRGKRVRNNTIEMIYSSITRARARIRLEASWNSETYVLAGGMGEPLQGQPVTPQGDSFLLYGRGARLLSLFLTKNVGPSALLFKEKGGKHLVYSGPKPLGEFYADDNSPVPRGVPYRGVRPVKVSFDSVVEANSSLVRILEAKSVDLLRRFEPDPDTVIVPWSGGKDSTAALLVAIEAYGRDAVTAVYVDTGIDFIENLEYVESVAGKLGINLVVKKADVDKGLLEEHMPMPHPEYRWCTGRKLDALREGFKEASHGKTIVVTGDRDGESERRGRRPVKRFDEKLGYPVLSPIKLWSGAHVQVYIRSRGLPLNPLYEAGFYRLGCYVCFALRSWEVNVMRKTGVIERIVRDRPHHKVLFDRFLELKKRGYGGEFGDCVCGV